MTTRLTSGHEAQLPGDSPSIKIPLAHHPRTFSGVKFQNATAFPHRYPVGGHKRRATLKLRSEMISAQLFANRVDEVERRWVRRP